MKITHINPAIPVIVLVLLVMGFVIGYEIMFPDGAGTGQGSAGSFVDVQKIHNYSLGYSDTGTFIYNFSIATPNPCYGLLIDTAVQESFPVQVIVDLTSDVPDQDIFCIQAITEQEVSGEINAQEVGQFTMTYDGELIFRWK